LAPCWFLLAPFWPLLVSFCIPFWPSCFLSVALAPFWHPFVFILLLSDPPSVRNLQKYCFLLPPRL
jgi:hypothetical protein